MAITKSLYGIIGAMILLAMFSIAIITFDIRLAANNNVGHSIGDSPYVAAYASALNDTLSTSYSTQSGLENATVNSPITKTASSPFIDATQGFWKTAKAIPTTVFNLVVGLWQDTIFNGQGFAVIAGMLGLWFGIGILFAAIKFFSSGDAKSEL